MGPAVDVPPIAPLTGGLITWEGCDEPSADEPSADAPPDEEPPDEEPPDEEPPDEEPPDEEPPELSFAVEPPEELSEELPEDLPPELDSSSRVWCFPEPCSGDLPDAELASCEALAGASVDCVSESGAAESGAAEATAALRKPAGDERELFDRDVCATETRA